MAGSLRRTGRIVLVATDLIRESRVVEGARALGYEVTVASTLSALREALDGNPAALLVLDLQSEGIAWRDALAAAREAATGRLPILAYGQHTRPNLLRAARTAGCDLAVPRSQLVEELPELIEQVAVAG